jgi:hypothetical protein
LLAATIAVDEVIPIASFLTETEPQTVDIILSETSSPIDPGDVHLAKSEPEPESTAFAMPGVYPANETSTELATSTESTNEQGDERGEPSQPELPN